MKYRKTTSAGAIEGMQTSWTEGSQGIHCNYSVLAKQSIIPEHLSSYTTQASLLGLPSTGCIPASKDERISLLLINKASRGYEIYLPAEA